MPIVVVVKCDPPPPVVWEGRCPNCRSRLQCFEGDLRVVIRNGVWGVDPTPEGDRTRVADCPVCYTRGVEFVRTGLDKLAAPDPKFKPAAKKKVVLPRKK